MNDSTRNLVPGKRYPIPAHVPPALVVDLDVYALPGGDVDPQLAWRQFALPEKGPLVYSPYNGGHWVPTTGARIKRVQRDFKNFCNQSITVPPRNSNLFPLESDPPDHTDYRRTINPLFSPAALKEMEPRLRRIAIDIIEGLRSRGECEFIADFAMRFPVIVIMQIFGLPQEDGLWLNRRADLFARHPDLGEKMKAFEEVTAYLDKYIGQRLEQGEDDGITHITRGLYKGCPYTRAQMLGTVSLLTLGGVDSVAMHLGFITLHLARHPEHLEYVKAHLNHVEDLIPEFNRRFSGTNQYRQVVHDMDFEGVQIKAGDMISVAAPIHNLDEEIYPHPTEIDFSRPTTQTHLTFGTGIHTCPGAALARLEVKIFLEEWLTRIPDFKVAEGRPVKLRASVLSAIDELFLQWSVQ